jgi:hypothetical protein
MTIAGCDYSTGRPPAASLKAAGIGFVCRYLSSDGSAAHFNKKDLTAAEIPVLHGAGIGIVLNYETTATFMLGGYAAGMQIARWARAQADSLGAPSSLPIYYSADLNATEEQVNTILDFLHGAADAEGSKTLVGVYGSYATVEAAAEAGFGYLWQTFAWSAGKWSAHAVLRQTHVGQEIGGAQVDLDQAMVADYGAWQPVSDVKPAPTPGVADRPEVRQGESGPWVDLVQRSLMVAGQDPQGVDGNFGQHTLEAVRAVQTAYRLAVDGVVGQHTWGALARRTEAVQKALNGKGAHVRVDAQAGPLTMAALVAFQKGAHLLADGIAGPLTSAALGLPQTS